MEAELKETLTFNISWQAEEDVTLTLARIIGSLDTQVLSVNSTDAEFFNNWANKGTADVINGTENTFHMTLTLDNIVLEDEGQYKILVEAESSSNTHYFAIQTYGKPFHHLCKPGVLSLLCSLSKEQIGLKTLGLRRYSFHLSHCNINLGNMI